MNGYKIVLLKAIFMLYRLPESERVCSGICTDAYMITGEGYEGFRMPAKFPKVPLRCTYSMEQPEFIKAYIESAELLGADKIKKVWLEIDGGKIVLRMKTK